MSSKGTTLNFLRILRFPAFNEVGAVLKICIFFFVLPFLSYEERLKTMVLREEFLPLMEEVKNAITVMTKAANGTVSVPPIQLFICLVCSLFPCRCH